MRNNKKSKNYSQLNKLIKDYLVQTQRPKSEQSTSQFNYPICTTPPSTNQKGVEYSERESRNKSALQIYRKISRGSNYNISPENWSQLHIASHSSKVSHSQQRAAYTSPTKKAHHSLMISPLSKTVIKPKTNFPNAKKLDFNDGTENSEQKRRSRAERSYKKQQKDIKNTENMKEDQYLLDQIELSKKSIIHFNADERSLIMHIAKYNNLREKVIL